MNAILNGIGLRMLIAGLIAALVIDGGARSVAAAVGGPDGDVTGVAGHFFDDDNQRCLIEDPDGIAETDGYCADQTIVRLAAGVDVNAINATFATETVDEVSGQRLFLLRLPDNSDEAAFAAQLDADARVVWAERNFIDQTPEGRPHRFFPRSDGMPVAGSLSQAYAPELIGAPAAWECASGSDVLVAVIDSGLDPDHPAFANTPMNDKDAWNAFSNQDGFGNVDDIGNSEDDDGDGFEDEMTGHGTHVAGIITQIAPGAAIMPIKALDSDGVGQAFYLARAIYRASDRSADIINLSLGSTANTRVVREATNAAVSGGILVVAAAGNAGPSGRREYPATLNNVFGVAATDDRDRPAEFSNVHASLDLSAPGVDIVSAFAIDQPPDNPLGSPWALWSGTSMATPWVAGAAALLMEQNPGWSANQVAARLRATAAPIQGSPAGMGSGRLDAGAAVACGQGGQARADDGQGDGKNQTNKGKKGKNGTNGKGKKGKNRR